MTDLLPIEIWNEVRSHLWTGLDQAAFRVVCRAFALHDPGPAEKGGKIEHMCWGRTGVKVSAEVRRVYGKARLRLATLAAELDGLIPRDRLSWTLAYGGAVDAEELDLNLEIGMGNDELLYHIRWVLDLSTITTSWRVYPSPDDSEEGVVAFTEARAQTLAWVARMLVQEDVNNTGAWW